MRVHFHPYSTPAVDRVQLATSRSERFTPREDAPDTHWVRGWVGPRFAPNAVANRQICNPCRESNSGPPTRSLVNSGSLALADRINKVNWKGHGRKVCLNLGNRPGICMKRLRKTTENLMIFRPQEMSFHHNSVHSITVICSEDSWWLCWPYDSLSAVRQHCVGCRVSQS